MAFKTGKQRTLTLVATVSAEGIISYYNGYRAMDPTHPPTDPNVDGTISISSGWGSCSITCSAQTNNDLGGTDGFIIPYVDLTATCGTTQTATCPGARTAVSPNTLVTVSADMSGTVTFSLDVEEWVEIGYSAYTSEGLAADPPVPCIITYYELPRPGGTASVSANIACGCSQSHIITGGEGVGYGITTGIDFEAGNTSATWSVVGVFNGVGLSVPGYSYSAPDGSGTSSSGTSLTLNNVHGTMGATISLPKSYSLSGRVNAMSDPYPDALKGVITDHSLDGTTPVSVLFDITGGSYGTGFVQEQYSAGSSLTGDPGASKNTYGGISGHRLQTASLQAVNEDTSDTRLGFRGWTWPAITASQTATLALDATPSAAHWTVGTNVTATGSGPMSILVANGHTGSVSSTLQGARSTPDPLTGTRWQGVDLSGYKYLTVDLTHTGTDSQGNPAAPSAYTLAIGSKQWTKDRLGNPLKTGAPQDIDLCCPTNATNATDATDTQWQWAGDTSGPYACASDGWGWGCHNVSSLSISGLAGGQGYNLSSLTLKRLDHTRLSAVPAFGNWVQAYADAPAGSNGTTTTYYRRMFAGDTDGALSLEQTDYAIIHIEPESGNDSWEYLSVSIKALADSFNTGNGHTFPTKGYSASAAVPAPTDGGQMLHDNFLNSDLDSAYIGGAGLLWDGTKWVSGFDNGLATAQFVFDHIEFYPGCGDVFGLSGSGGSSDGTLILRSGAVLRGSTVGLVYSTDGKPAANALLQMDPAGTTPTGASGTATEGGLGEYYHTPTGGTKTPGIGLPCGKGGQSYDVRAKAGITTYPTITGSIPARYRKRASFRVVLVDTCCNHIFCSGSVFFPFAPQAGDHARLPLDDWQAIEEEEEESTATPA